MMCSLANFMCFVRSPESLNTAVFVFIQQSQEQQMPTVHYGHLLFLTLLSTHLMCLDRTPE
jgi:hypothetical protein